MAENFLGELFKNVGSDIRKSRENKLDPFELMLKHAQLQRLINEDASEKALREETRLAKERTGRIVQPESIEARELGNTGIGLPFGEAFDFYKANKAAQTKKEISENDRVLKRQSLHNFDSALSHEGVINKMKEALDKVPAGKFGLKGRYEKIKGRIGFESKTSVAADLIESMRGVARTFIAKNVGRDVGNLNINEQEAAEGLIPFPQLPEGQRKARLDFLESFIKLEKSKELIKFPEFADYEVKVKKSASKLGPLPSGKNVFSKEQLEAEARRRGLKP